MFDKSEKQESHTQTLTLSKESQYEREIIHI